jgi:60 kDa SS-A/Ro ribonucleoprotein
MGCGCIAGIEGLTPRVASAAMAMVTARVEKDWHVMGFSHELVDIPISPRQRLDDVVEMIAGIPMGGTDCSLPMRWAKEKKAKVDGFVVYTDNETWAGDIHPSQALVTYRRQLGINSKLVVVGMVANDFTIADPEDAGMLDVVGFDSAAPSLIQQFVAE